MFWRGGGRRGRSRRGHLLSELMRMLGAREGVEWDEGDARLSVRRVEVLTEARKVLQGADSEKVEGREGRGGGRSNPVGVLSGVEVAPAASTARLAVRGTEYCSLRSSLFLSLSLPLAGRRRGRKVEIGSSFVSDRTRVWPALPPLFKRAKERPRRAENTSGCRDAPTNVGLRRAEMGRGTRRKEGTTTMRELGR
jgi:hypothetical protein